ncbi:hypothetical protein [Clostridium sp. HBUAS56017]|uniref:hypothetical protein n=1 Tax=Clostridium sp. HBUAS56017 TaxID=2571128 RepID=UPI00117851BF|nr:hypothetical protein [Clostridium sp. HBUAS56017]
MIDKEELREKVKKAIEEGIPYTALVTRSGEDKYHKKINDISVCTLTGIKYLNGKNRSQVNITIDNGGVNTDNETIRFLVDWNEESVKVKKGDIIKILGESFIVKSLGNMNEICFDMQLEVKL